MDSIATPFDSASTGSAYQLRGLWLQNDSGGWLAAILVQQSEHHAGAEVLAGGVLESRAVEQHEQGARFNLVGLRDAAEFLRKGGQVAGELRADAGVCKQGALLHG